MDEVLQVYVGMFIALLKTRACTLHFKSIENNRLRQLLSAEFYDWVLEADLKINQEYYTPDLLKAFRELYNLGEEFKQRHFSNQLREYAHAKGLDINFRSSNGKSFFKLTKES